MIEQQVQQITSSENGKNNSEFLFLPGTGELPCMFQFLSTQ